MTVDGIHTERWTTAGTFTMLASSRLYVGGADQATLLPGLRTRNEFIGCLRKVSPGLPCIVDLNRSKRIFAAALIT